MTHTSHTVIARLLVVLACLALGNSVRAQGLVASPPPFDINTPGLTMDSVAEYLKSGLTLADTGEGRGESQANEFIRLWKDRAVVNPTSGPNMFHQYFRGLKTDATARRANVCATSTQYQGNWTNIGPDSLPTSNLGLFSDTWTSPYTRKHMLAASYGGVFRTRDSGKNWNCITDNAPVAFGVITPHQIAVSPTDTATIYLGSYIYPQQTIFLQGLSWLLYGNAVLSTSNSGATWTQEILSFHTTPDFTDSVAKVQGVYFAPNGKRVYALRDSAIFFKYLGTAWKTIHPATSMTGKYIWNRVEFMPTTSGSLDSTRCFASASTVFDPNSTNAYLMEGAFNPATRVHSWTNIPLPAAAGQIHDIAFRIANPDLMVLFLYGRGTTPSQIWTLNPNTKQWHFVTNYRHGLFTFDVSKANPANLYLANNALDSSLAYFSNDTGHTFHAISTYQGNPTHGDVRSVHVYSSTNTANGLQDVVYFGSDGGVFMKPAGVNPFVSGTNTCVNINGKGLTGGRYMGVGGNEHGLEVFGSTADNGYLVYEPKKNPKWWNLVAGDGEEAAVSRKGDYAIGGSSGGGYTESLDRLDSIGTGGRAFANWSNVDDVSDPDEPHSGQIPLWPDQFNGMYVGQSHMWRYLPTVYNKLIRASAQSPTYVYKRYDVKLPEYRRTSDNKLIPIKAMSFSQYYDSLTGYVLYQDGALFSRNDSLRIPTKRGLFSRINDTTIFNTGSSINALDVVCNPAKPKEVWVTLGGINWDTQPRNRVLFSPNEGKNWFDVSNGLPTRLPVTHIVKHEGFPFLYCSTDVGIFKLDMSTFKVTDSSNRLSAYNTVQWTCFNKGATGQPDFPMVNVSDLEINYCDGKLLASTYGRNLWSTDLLVEDPNYLMKNIGDAVPEPTYIVTGRDTLRGDVTLYTGIRIKKYASLYIMGSSAKPTTVHMPKNGAIIVEPGGYLEVDSAKITNDCSGFWKGILVEGKISKTTFSADRGVAKLLTGSIIEHARVGVANYGESVDPNAGPTEGGVLVASGAFFRNCRRGFIMAPVTLRDPNTKKIIKDLSIINNSDFWIDNNYRGDKDYGFSAHVLLFNVNEIPIQGSTFKNVSTLPNTKGVGFGINTWGASFFTVPYFLSSYANLYIRNPNRFEGLKAAIYTEDASLNPLDYAFIDSCEFKNNGVGIYAHLNNWCEVFRNNFLINAAGPSYDNSCNCVKGLYLLNTEQFRIEENSFTAIGSAPYDTYGGQIDESRVSINDFYRNKFTGLKFGIRAYGNNGAPLIRSGVNNYNGLQVSCNNFVNNTNSIYVDGPGNGIRGDQGSAKAPVENTFVRPSNGAPFDINNKALSIKYWFKTNPPLRLANVTTSATATTNSCAKRTILVPPDFNTPSYPAKRDASIQNFADASDLYHVTVAGIKSKVDGGSTSSFNTWVSTAPSGLAIVDSMLKIVPYISYDAFTTVIQDNRVQKAQLLQLLIACPDVLNEDFYQYLASNPSIPFTQNDLDVLRTHESDVSQLTNDNATAADAYKLMTASHREIIMGLKADTNGLDVDTLASWMQKLPEPWSHYGAAMSYLGTGEYAKCDAVMNTIQEQFALTGDSLNEYNTYKTLISALKPVFQDNRTELSLNSAELATIDSIANINAGRPSEIARAIYNRNLTIEDIPCQPALYVESTPPTAKTRGNAGQTTKAAVSGGWAKAFPNPAKSYIGIEYDYQNYLGGSLHLEISNVDGKLAYAADLPSKSGIVNVDLKRYVSGTYLYSIKAGSELVTSGKFEVAK